MVKGAYKRKGIRIVEDEPPKIDYAELKRLQAKYRLTEIGHKIDRLKKQMTELEKQYDQLRRESV